jgi:signal transduction histidine kinase
VSSSITTSLAITVPAIVLTTVLLLITLWQDLRSETNRFYTAFMVMVMLWMTGTFTARIAAIISPETPGLIAFGVRLMEFGLVGASIGIVLVVVSLTGTRRVYLPLVVVAAVYEAYLLATPSQYSILDDRTLVYLESPITIALLLYFIGAAALITWQQQKKIRDPYFRGGIFIFCLGLAIEVIGPELRNQQIGVDICALAALCMGYSMVRTQIIVPLAGRSAQMRAIRDVGLTITSRVRLEEVLSTIAAQAATLIEADGAAIFMNQNGILELAAVFNMPEPFIGTRLGFGDGLTGLVALTRTPERLENYKRDWHGLPDTPFAKQAFGSTIAVPLIFADEVMGVLLVVVSPYGKRFDQDDMQMLDLLGPQAAVAITNSRLYGRQHALTTELESAKNQLETVLTSTENPVIALNRKLAVIFANPAAETLFDTASLRGKSLRDIVPMTMLPHKPLLVLRSLHRNGAYVYEVKARDHTYLCHIALLGRSQSQGYVVVLNDVSELKELDRLKNEMIHMTSHDLKNPLTAAMHHIELIQEEYELNEDMARDVALIAAQLVRMQRIISGILDLERVKSGKSTVEEFDLGPLIETVTRDLADQAFNKGIILIAAFPEGLPPMVGARQPMMQAINNLVENAIKFTPSGGKVAISAEFIDDCIVLHIADTGIGIPLEAQSRIFERFYQARRPGYEDASGTGLGLSLVKAVIDAHQGRIWLESEVDRGTTIHLALPIHAIIDSTM